MNASLHSLVPNWFRREEYDMPDDIGHDGPPKPPPIASIPLPEPTEEERRLKVIADAHMFVAQFSKERDVDRREIEQLKQEKAELEIKLKQEQRKSGLLELDIAQHVNTIATLQSEVNEHKGLLDLLRDINEKSTAAFARLNITGTKKESRAKNAKQKPKGKTDNGQSTDQPAKADG